MRYFVSFTCTLHQSDLSSIYLSPLGGISEKDYAFEEIQSRSRESHLGDSLSHKPSSVPLPRRRPRRRGTALSEGWKDITDDSGMYLFACPSAHSYELAVDCTIRERY